jgi:hypothetical protein
LSDEGLMIQILRCVHLPVVIHETDGNRGFA